MRQFLSAVQDEGGCIAWSVECDGCGGGASGWHFDHDCARYAGSEYTLGRLKDESAVCRPDKIHLSIFTTQKCCTGPAGISMQAVATNIEYIRTDGKP